MEKTSDESSAGSEGGGCRVTQPAKEKRLYENERQ